ncbi:MAG: hypothetical protein BGO01_04665 [Armatimonadetes bacterium 55-13]|nr:redoxin domain-containing protein [Armatimonadota bacterium]OJU61387.1 MAG: hypothetical protein BGO01_04665 [Armatimonadetes bacterium 55-13]
MNKLAVTAYLGLIVLSSGVYVAEARPAYAQKEGKQCVYCHTSSRGGVRGFRGQFYGANNLTFRYFEEQREASIAGVTPDSTGSSSAPTVAYAGNTSGPATSQIQLAALRTPVLVFFVDQASADAKEAMKGIHELQKAYGTKVSVLAVTKADEENAVKMTSDLGSFVRVLPDEKGTAIKKFSVANGFDFVVVGKRGDYVKSFEGLSKANLDGAVKAIAADLEVEAPTFDESKLPAKTLRGKAF